jgi:signal peptidase I
MNTEDTKKTKKKEDKEEVQLTPEEKKKAIIKEIRDLVIYFLIVLCISILVVVFVIQRTVVEGSSMNPTLSNGDNLIVNKITYKFSDPKRYDIVVFPYQHKKHTYYIKRIIGLPGETIQIDHEGNIYINGEILDEDYGKEVILDPGRASEPITLGSDEYFVMGDNRNDSSDSRDYMVGNVKKKDFIGKIWIRVYPFKEFGVIPHAKDKDK